MSRNTVSDFVSFEDPSLGRKWSSKKIPFSDVYEAYIDGQLDIPADKWDDFFKTRHETMSFRLTDSHIRWAFTNFLPEVTIHSKSQDARIVGEHYNRGNDFFEWCLGEAMVYTAASFETPDMPLAQAQYRKIDRACNKLQLKAGETLLDIGCGWGTFVARAAKEFGAKTYGVTLAQEQVNFGTERIRQYGVADRAKVEVCDYRNVQGPFDKIVSLEMVEHVGIKNLVGYYQKVHELLKDDGLFVIQWTGIRNLYNPQNPLSALTLRPEDLIWALFMNRYIFPGADASLPLSGMIRAAEDGGFEVTDVENMSPHYVLTLRHWRDIWQSNRENVIKSYGERWYRLWYFFLHWSALIGEQGSAFTYQMLMHKNSDSFDRKAIQFSSGKYWR
ncbi:MAG TPA: cyclopropane-fatty-acyl-phospholipid synthase family protein [Polyangiaceae bacterium]|nr:cyclopropane-fatty-acyl-phospholipid synthase family protein [Polyangiaceae bacterium]